MIFSFRQENILHGHIQFPFQVLKGEEGQYSFHHMLLQLFSGQDELLHELHRHIGTCFFPLIQ
jgi:hypothetical protein